MAHGLVLALPESRSQGARRARHHGFAQSGGRLRRHRAADRQPAALRAVSHRLARPARRRSVIHRNPHAAGAGRLRETGGARCACCWRSGGIGIGSIGPAWRAGWGMQSRRARSCTCASSPRDTCSISPPTWELFRRNLKRNVRESLRHCYNSLRREGIGFSFEVAASAADVARAHRLRGRRQDAPVLLGIRSALRALRGHDDRHGGGSQICHRPRLLSRIALHFYLGARSGRGLPSLLSRFFRARRVWR